MSEGVGSTSQTYAGMKGLFDSITEAKYFNAL